MVTLSECPDEIILKILMNFKSPIQFTGYQKYSKLKEIFQTNRFFIALATISHRFKELIYNYAFHSIYFPGNIDPMVLPRFQSLEICASEDNTFNFSLISKYHLTGLSVNQKRADILEIFGYGSNIQRLEMGNPWEYNCNSIEISDSHLESLPVIRILKLQHSNITDWGLQWLTKIEILDIGGDEITNEGLKSISGVKILDIGGQLITDDGLQHIPNVECLTLDGNSIITGTGFIHLVKLKKFKSRCNKAINDDTLKYLSRLTHLSLNSNEIITDMGLQHLSNIRKLNLAYNSLITSKGLKYIGSVQSLNLEYNYNINHRSVKYLPNITKVEGKLRFHYGKDGCMK